MRRIFTCYHVFLTVTLAVLLPVYWTVLIVFGNGPIYYRYVRLGPIAFDMETLLLFTVILAPTAFFSFFYLLRRTSRDGQRLIWWRSLPFMSNWYAVQATLLLAVLLAFGTPWSGMMSTNWRTVLSSLTQSSSTPTPPSDAELKFPELPLPAYDPYNWTIQDMEGNEVSMATFKGKAVFLNFWATWCGFCLFEFPNIQNLYNEMKDEPNMAFVLVSPEEPDVVSKWVSEQEYTMPFYTVAREALPSAFSPSGLPTTFILTSDGRTAFRHSGFVAWDGENTKNFLRTLATAATAPPEDAQDEPDPPDAQDTSDTSDTSEVLEESEAREE